MSPLPLVRVRGLFSLLRMRYEKALEGLLDRLVLHLSFIRQLLILGLLASNYIINPHQISTFLRESSIGVPP